MARLSDRRRAASLRASRPHVTAVFLASAVLLAALLLAARPATAQSRTLIVGSEVDYPPFALGTPNGEPGGFTVELWRAVAAEAGINYEIRVAPFGDILQGFRDGQIDVLINLAQSEQRRAFADFAVPHVTAYGAIFVRRGDSRIRSEADLADKSLIVLRADLAHDYAISQGWGDQLALADDTAAGLRLLAEGRHDAMLVNKIVGLQTLHDIGIDSVVAVPIQLPFFQKFSFAVHKGNADLLARINEGLAITKADGTYDTLYEQWFGVLEPRQVGLSDVLRIATPYIIPVLVIFGVVLLALARQRQLLSELAEQSTQLRRNQQRLAEAQRLAQLGNWSYDLMTRSLEWSEQSFLIFGRDPAGPPPSYDESMAQVHADDRPRLAAALAALEEHGQPYDLEHRIHRPSGEVRWLRTKADADIDASGRVVLLFGTLIDITEERQADETLQQLNAELEARVRERTAQLEAEVAKHQHTAEALRASESRLRAMFNALPDIIFRHRHDTTFIDYHAPSAELLLMPPEHFIGRTYAEVFPAAQADVFTRVLRRAIETGELQVYEYPLPMHGEQRYYETRMAVSGPDELISIIRDVTERRRAEDALIQRTNELSAANAALDRAARMKDEFLASMSHELRTPLTGVLGLAEALQRQVYGPLNDRQLKSLRAIEESGHHLLDLINDILDLSKIEAGKLDLEVNLVSVEDICQASLRMVRQMAQAKQQSVAYSLNPLGLQLQADPRRLKQVLMNLLSNAVKFTPDNGQIGLQVEGDSASQVVHFTVWDHGIGIAPDALSQLFRPFVQLDNSLARMHGGTGLGLSLVQRMAELHGGGVSVESTPGKGSRFTVTLPWPQPSATHYQARQPGTKYIVPTLRRTVTIEDSWITAEQITRYLNDMGVANVVIANAERVVERVTEVAPDLILLDILLPDGSGWDVLAQLKADPRTSALPVVIVSVLDDQTRALEIGANGYLNKPVSFNDLRNVLGQVMQQTNAQTDPSVLVLAPKPAPPSHAPLILLAEDNQITVELLQDVLVSNGMKVIFARHGFEVIEKVRLVRPDLILMDIQMPGMDGLEATRRIRAEADAQLAATPIVAVTALAMPGDRERCIAAGANGYLSKPVNLDALLLLIHELLETQQKI